MIKSKQLYRIIKELPIYDECPSRYLSKPEVLNALPFQYVGNFAYLLTKEHGAYTVYRFKTTTVGNTRFVYCDKQPAIERIWKDKESFDAFMEKYGAENDTVKTKF